MNRVIAYIDGFNLYHGLRQKKWKRYYWLNVQRMVRLMLKPDQVLVKTKYFTAIVTDPPDKRIRQAVFLDALRTCTDLDIYYGHFLAHPYTCWKCGDTHLVHHEKMTDVNIATQLLSDAFQDQFDTALLYSADSDLVGPLETVKRLFQTKCVVAAFPPARFSAQLSRVASAHTRVSRVVLAKSQFADQLTSREGFVLQRPAEWR